VGVLILTLAVTTWLQRKRNQGGVPVSPWWPTLTLVWVCVQGAFGALTVTMKLFPAIVTLHLLGGLALLALLCVQAVRYAQAWHETTPVPLSATTRWLLMATFAAVWMQVALGGWVSTNYAVLACNEFPQCQNSWWPYMEFREGFTLWRELGKTAAGEHIGFGALTAIHYTHRLAAYVVLGLLAWLAWRLRHVHALRAQARWIAGLALWQFATGLSNVVLDWPLVAAVSHTGGAAALVVVLTWALCESLLRRILSVLPTSMHRACRHEHSNPDPQGALAHPAVQRADQAARDPAHCVLRAHRHGAGRAGRAVVGARAAGRHCLPGHLADGRCRCRLQLHC
jgi:cytochrome c oxidase assembly protein subunit 15